MEISAKYVYTVYKEKSFSAAAKALYLSQPALSTAVSKHEKELGFRIFDRKTVPLALTPQGKIYIESLEEIINIEDSVSRRIKEMTDVTYGTLAVGGASSASYRLLSVICGEFHRRYPNIRVRLDMGGSNSPSDNLSEKLRRHTVDIVMSYAADDTDNICEPIFEERLLVVMSKKLEGAEKIAKYSISLDRALSREYPSEAELCDPSVFSDIPFLTYRKKSATTQRMREILGEFKTVPYEIVNIKHSDMHYHMMCHGLGAVMVTDVMLRTAQNTSDDLLYFLPNSPLTRRMIYLVRNSTSPSNPIADKFIAVAKEICASEKLEL